MEATLISLLTEVGFPILVTFYLLHRIEAKLNVLIEAINVLPDRLNSPKRGELQSLKRSVGE